MKDPEGIGEERLELVLRVLRPLTLLVAVAAAATYPLVALLRLGYPFELQEMEGGVMAMAVRAAAGEPVFIPPSMDYIPFNYTPLYVHAAAPFLRLFGAGLGALRALSFAASVGTLILLFAVVLRLTANRRAALLAACLFAAGYYVTGTYYDLARPDSLHVLFLGAGLSWLLLDRSEWRAGIAAGSLIALAHFTKQSAVLSVIPFVAYACLRRRAVGWVTGVTLLVTILAASFLLESSSQGWFSYYTTLVATGHGVEWSRLGYFAMRIAGLLAVATAIGLAWFAFGGLGRSERAMDVTLLMGGPVLAATYMCLYPYSDPNVAMPGVFAIALMFGLGWNAVEQRLRERAGPVTRRLEALVLVACMLQFTGLVRDPRKLIPTAADRLAGWKLVQRIREEPGPVYSPFALELVRLAGKPPIYHRTALMDMWKCDRSELPGSLDAALQKDLEAGRWSMLLLDPAQRQIVDSIPGYGPEEELFPGPKEAGLLWMRSGWPTRPEYVRRAINGWR